MNKIKSLLKNFWFWLRSKTTLDEKAIDVYEEVKDRAKEIILGTAKAQNNVFPTR